MAAICTSTVSPSGCGHRTLTVNVDGQLIAIPLHDAEAAVALTPDELTTLVQFTARRLRSKGVTLAQFLNRVLIGDEATNVKCYNVLGPGAAVTKTNIGTAYVNIPIGANGERILIDFTGCVEMRVIVSANFPAGSLGAFGLRLVRDSDNTVLFENAAITAAPTGERELDTDWVALPAWALASTQVVVRLQGKSATAADDPIFRRVQVFTR